MLINIKNRYISSHQAPKNIRVRSVWYFTAACLQLVILQMPVEISRRSYNF